MLYPAGCCIILRPRSEIQKRGGPAARMSGDCLWTVFLTHYPMDGTTWLTMRASDIADVLIVAALIYWLIGVIRRTNTYRVATGIVILLLVMWISGLLRLTMIHSLLQRTLEMGLIALGGAVPAGTAPHFGAAGQRAIHEPGHGRAHELGVRHRADRARLHGHGEHQDGRAHRVRAHDAAQRPDGHRHHRQRRRHERAAAQHLFRQGPAARWRGHHPRGAHRPPPAACCR